MKRSREQQGRPETQPTLVHRSGFHSLLRARLILLHLALAFGCGWLLAFFFTFLVASSLDLGTAVVCFVLFPPLLGLAAVATMGRRITHLTLLSIGTGWLVLIGFYTYRYPLASQNDAAFQTMCATSGLHCHVGPVAVALLNLFLVYGMVVVLLGAGITGLLIQRHHKRESHSETDSIPH